VSNNTLIDTKVPSYTITKAKQCLSAQNAKKTNYN